MKLAEVAHITQTTLEDGRTIDNGFLASFDKLSIVGNGILIGAVGFGANKREARKALAAKVSGKTVARGLSRPRTEIPLPKVTP